MTRQINQMKPRRTITAAMAARILIAQAAEAGKPIVCALCPDPILPGQKVQREHLHALALGGEDDESNIRFAHHECSMRKTNGRGATTLGSDRHAIAKQRRLTGKNKPRPKAKIRNAGFDRRRKRKLNGEIVTR